LLHRALTRAGRGLASLKLTLAALAFLAGGVVYAYLSGHHMTLWLVMPLLLLSLNLLAAIAVMPAFRRSGPLLLFHLALLAIVLLVAAGRLSSLKGHVELTQGEEFSGVLTGFEAGPWHPSGLHRLRFVNEGFTIDYDPGLMRKNTRNLVRYVDEVGQLRHDVIGDQNALVLQGYRFYTTPNKGFAPTFLWYPAQGGEPMLGSVHLPSYPIHEYEQSRDWQLPGTELRLWTMLQFDEIILDPARPSEFRLPDTHKLVVRAGELRREMKPGDAMELPAGRLVYQGLRTWMGYTVFYDWTIHWLLGVSLVAVAALAWHFWNKFAVQPWDRTT
jgi:hypothetical protein